MSVQSFFLLGLALIKTLLLRLAPAKNPVERFNSVYGKEGILSVLPVEAAVLKRAGTCTACGRCDRDQAERVKRTRVGYRGMMAFALGGARSLTDAPASALVISELTEDEIARAEALCPQGVPLLDLSRLVRHHARRIHERTGGGGEAAMSHPATTHGSAGLEPG